ncbi:MAG: hypothetical protein IJX77_10190 [Ruminococcus sp.]|nr:hypothetical protein [Ruminococcus sp.]
MNTLALLLALSGSLLALVSANMALEMLSERSERRYSARMNALRGRAYGAVRERKNKAQNRQTLWRALEK